MATLSSLVERVRLELGDLGKSFVTQFVADGTTNRFKLHYAPLDGPNVIVLQNGVDISDACLIEESTGVLITPDVPADGAEMLVSGTYYRYFTTAELEGLVTDAVAQHVGSKTDQLGRKITVENLPIIEEYPAAIYAVTIALYTLATDASFDIDIAAPDGVSIPRSERYRQLMDMIAARKEQYRELCIQLGVGMFSIEVFSLRRISKATGRYVPVYKPQEVDDRSYPDRVDDMRPTYGDKPAAWPTQSVELTAYQGRPFTADVSFEAPTGSELVAKLLNQRGSVVMVQEFTSDFIESEDTPGTYTGTISLTGDQTLRIAQRTYWSIQVVEDGDTVIEAEIKGGNFFTVRASTVVL
jgi:hypothetical protein